MCRKTFTIMMNWIQVKQHSRIVEEIQNLRGDIMGPDHSLKAGYS